MDIQELYLFARAHRLAVLSTASPTGNPQSALVGIAVSDQLEIAFDCVRSSRKYRNLKQHPHVSFVIGWETETTLQYEGLAAEPEGDSLRRLKQFYFAAWPECVAHETWPDITWILVQPAWLRYSDFSTGRTEEITFP